MSSAENFTQHAKLLKVHLYKNESKNQTRWCVINNLFSTYSVPENIPNFGLQSNIYLTFTTFWANSADNKLVIFLLFFLENRLWQHEISNPVFWEK